MATFKGLATLSYHCEIHPSTVGRVTGAPAAEGGGTGDAARKPVASAEGGVWTGIIRWIVTIRVRPI